MALNLDDPSEVALAASAAFDRAGLQAALYGGLALAVYGEPRETRDADLAVATVSVGEAKAALDAAGIASVVAFSDMRFGGLSIGRVTIVGGGKLNMIDLVTPRCSRYAGAVLTRSLRGALEGQELSVVAAEDFILLKTLSTRDHDLVDARTVWHALRDRLDRELMDREAGLLAVEIADHDVRGRYSSVIS